MEDFFRQQYRIPSARVTWHHYREGIYFITICTHQHKPHFGRIISTPGLTENQIQLTEIGKYVETCIHKIETLHHNVFVPSYQIMPNHIHLIIIDEQPDVDGSQRNMDMRAIAKRCGLLSHLISQFKSAITKFAHLRGIPFAWQTRFYDRIIRNQNELNAIVDYIENNPYKYRIPHSPKLGESFPKTGEFWGISPKNTASI